MGAALAKSCKWTPDAALDANFWPAPVSPADGLPRRSLGVLTVSRKHVLTA
jgi:hypothetical protein